MTKDRARYFHLHLISDATGETLSAIAKAASVQFSQLQSIEHVHPLVRTKRKLSRVMTEIEAAPGIVLYTIINKELGENLQEQCREKNLPCIPVLEPVMKIFESYLGAPSTPTVGGQHVLNAEYFRRIEALNFTMIHDDGQFPDDLDQADIIIVGISRTSKTPTSIYLANRGYKTVNVPLVLDFPLPQKLEASPDKTFVVGLIASAERIAHVRRNRVMDQHDKNLKDYVDQDMIKAEISFARRLCTRYSWPVIDVTRRSIEETAAAILKLYHDREAQKPDA